MKQPKVSGAAKFIITVLSLLFFTSQCNNSNGTSTPASLLPVATNNFQNQATILNLTASIPEGSEMRVVRVWGPENDTWAVFQVLNGTRQFLAKCQQWWLGRPAEGSRYTLSESDNTLLSPEISGYQEFRIMEELVAASQQPTTPTATFVAPALVQAAGTQIPGETPTGNNMVPVGPFLRWACPASLVLLLVVAGFIILRNRFAK